MSAATTRDDGQLTSVSMYAELLMVARAHRRDRESAVIPTLARELTSLRTARLLSASKSGDEVAGDLAHQLAYDLVLLELCDAADVGWSPAGFDRPLVERERLEAAIRQAGIDIGPSGGPPLRTARDVLSPDGDDRDGRARVGDQ